MNFKDFPLFSEDLLTLTSKEDMSRFRPGHKIQLQPYSDNWMAVQGDARVIVNCNPVDRILFERLAQRDQVQWLLTTTRKGQLLVQYCAPVEVTPMDLELGLDELIVEDLYSKREIGGNNIELACRWFESQFVVDAEGEYWLTIAKFSNRTAKGGFQLLGKGWRADVERRDEGALLIKRVTRHKGNDSAFSLLTGDFTFVDASVAAVLSSGSQQAILDATLRDNESYLELWNLYNDKEWQNALKQAETLRSLRFVDWETFEDGRENAWRLIPRTPDDYREFRDRWTGLDLSSNTQVDIGINPPDWMEELTTDESESASANTPRGTIVFKSDHVIFKPASNRKSVRPREKEGWLYLSLAGHRTAGKRRLAAKQSIDSGKRLPQLKWLLEGVAVPAARRRRIDGLTPYAKETFKGGKPTEKQIQALDAALNTPDLAIVIGPPGTGKTQVIAALQRRLAEESQDQNLSGQVLISSFQHDAVDNALDRSDVLGLPATRIGGKRGSGDDEALIVPWLERQTSYLQEKVATEYEKYPELKKLKEISETMAFIRVAGYEPYRLAEELEKILAGVKALEAHGLIIPPSIEAQLGDYINELYRSHQSTQNKVERSHSVLRKIRALRETETSFLDDGPDRAWDLLSWLKRNAPRADGELLSFLEQIADTEQVDQSGLKQLVGWKNRLLDLYLPDYRPPELRFRINDKGLELLNDLERLIESKVQKRKQGVAWVLEQLSDSLNFDRQAAQSVVDEYSMVVGATCQQSAGQQMANLKAVAGFDSSEIEFETVVVDEAARANPLDLFVPMAMAKRRIVLVGDDRQLPHMLEPNIEGQLQEEHDLTEQQLAAFRSSLFERLRVKLQDLERQDTIRRVVMLDTQFRMHPVLGDFVSKHFYEAAGLGKLQSGRSAEDFAFSEMFLSGMQELRQHYQGHVCQWINVPLAEGNAVKRGTSRVREVEAEHVVTEVRRVMEAGGESVSVGVITFYAAQRDFIMEKMAQTKIDGKPLMVKQESGYEPHDDFKWTKKQNADGSYSQEERLRVGSVDAFQGKEFDVVLLSCVRTYQPTQLAKIQWDDDAAREEQLNRQFGFLRLPNRMNVAMSRQRQMLVCVGDANLATNPVAKEAVPALAALYELCGGDHGSLR
ncbi:AAA domain-containing protein [Halomonas sp. PAMB 3264]|uniref:DEAD/DEAH box helicase n=1 Tax=Halomonas sp. PAMB 3264 TaxID=3075222 RepID=UPI00289FB1E7|nr:AAA domain-containing protein [Halomonas sp. PAMB 3264]WNL42739.1 AAA domain-containing protein [Halomonas sp. PAMB 3264]